MTLKKLYIGISIIAVGVILAYLYIFFAQLPKPTYKLNAPIELLTPEVKKGEEVRWKVNICKLHDKDFYVQRTFFNLDTGIKYVVPEYGTRGLLNKGECRINQVSQRVPDDLVPGKYQLIGEIFVKSNRWSIDKFQYTVGVFIIK